MGHKSKKSLKQQVDEELRSMLAIGQSKHADKATGETVDKIYSYGTLKAYQQQCIAFAVYCKQVRKALQKETQYFAMRWLTKLHKPSLCWVSALHPQARLYTRFCLKNRTPQWRRSSNWH